MSQSYQVFPFSSFTRQVLKMSLQEDIGQGDITSGLLIAKDKQGRAVIVAKEAGIFCGQPVASALFAMVDSSLKVKFVCREGQKFSRKKTLLEISGSVHSILKAERVVLNYLAHLCGIATLTAQFVRSVKGYPVFILDTRKTTPLMRELEKYAVRTGGGRNHRMGLYDGILIKENHRVQGDLDRIQKKKGRYEIEVRNMREFNQALAMEPGVILFDNFKPSDLQRAVSKARRFHPQIILEASGGINLENVTPYAALGVDWISVGALTHSAKPIDLSLLMK